MNKELVSKIESITLKKPILQKLCIADDDCIETIVIKGKDYKTKEIVKQDEVLRIIKENLNIQEILLAVRGVCKASDYDLVKEVLL